MLIRSLIIVFLTASSSLYGGVVSNYSNTYFLKGTYQDGSNIGTDTVSGTQSDEDFYAETDIPSGPDGYQLTLTGWSQSFEYEESHGFLLSGNYSLNNSSGIQTQFTIRNIANFTMESAGNIRLLFNSLSLTNGFTGTAYIKLDGVSISSSGTFDLAAGVHSLEIYADGLNVSPATSDANQSFSVSAEVTAVPEPSSWVLIASGAAAAFGVIRRRRSQRL